MQFLQYLSAQKNKLVTAIIAGTGNVNADKQRIVATGLDGKIASSLLDTSTVAGAVLVRGADGKIADTDMPPGYTPDVNPAVAAEALSPGDNVEWFNDGTAVAKARKANATAGTERAAGGYVREAFAQGAPVKVYADGTNTFATGLAPGKPVFLDTTAGKATTTEPAAPHMLQWIGTAVTDTSYDYQIHIATVRS